MTNLKWQGPYGVLAHAAAIVRSYNTGVTLRQLFYRLVADGTLPNTRSKYAGLSAHTAEGRRGGTFPDLLDRTSRIERRAAFSSPASAMDALVQQYRRNRTEGQPLSIYLIVEKAGLTAQLDAWFGNPLGLPIVPLGGYASQSLVDKVRRDVARQGRRAIGIYAGDHDPSGEDLDRDFEERVGIFDKFIRVALSPEQVAEFRLPFNPDPVVISKLQRDTRARSFMERHGIRRYEDLVQYEVDALAPETLRDLYRNAIDEYWDPDAHEAVLAAERADLEVLGDLRSSLEEE